MANYSEFTRSRHDGVVLDEEGVEALLAEYHVEPNVEIQDGRIEVYGYCGFNVWAMNEDRSGSGYEDNRTHEFLFGLSDLIDGNLWIKTVGHEKLRYVDAYMWHLKDGEVFHATLEDNEAKVPRQVIEQ